ncbi:hypothetical protein EXIGLDRAFT_728943 [Exidia glandulosa HHB12029]|uniref:Alpha/beta-hydrolase n=1 Tax=Exidia glandulosa HHB12029 TaxID=1314781 RepID=A0A165LNW4_EXIGL|nr:hypothetical protein EXIGLDRAFT_728943 [Exidia glandulosa HHB12029]
MPVVQNSHRIAVNSSANGVSFSFASYVSPNTYADAGFAPTQGFVFVHGQNRDADEMVNAFKAAVPKAVSAGFISQAGDAVLLAPVFAHAEDTAKQLFPSALTWCGNDWMQGLDSPSAAVSSFDVLTGAFKWLATTYPSIKTFVLVGHSAGGQTVQRYTVVNPSTSSPSRYIIANPSSVAYFTAERPNCTVSSSCTCTAPGYTQCCSSFNEWKYGLDDYTPRFEHAAMTASNHTSVINRYIGRTVHYLYGTADSAGQTNGCESNAQGLGHFDRGQKWWTYLTAHWPSVTSTQTKDNVQGIGHDGVGMLSSTEGVQRLFQS